MIAIFLNPDQANNFSNKIHEYLKLNREGYQAEKWQGLNKAASEDKYCIFIPEDYEITEAMDTVESLPVNW